jgi:alpha-tubulin suppressor-like RCC1 family protein
MHTCGIDSTGRAWCWGDDSVGQVGDGNDSQTTEFAPVQVADNHTFTRLTAGAYHTCGIDTTGKAWCWGIGDARLGNGAGGPPFEPAPTPVTTTVAFAQLSTGSEHTCGIDTTGKAWCWGNDHYGQVGDGNDDQGAESTPVHVAGTLNFTALSAGSMHTCAIDTTGRAWCWGTDYYGELGDGNDGQADEYSPRPVDNSLTFTRLTAAGQHTCGIDTAGKAWCWGSDHYGQLGDGNDSQADEYSPVPVATSLTFTHLTAAGVHSCGIDTAGKAWCWGSDGSGQLGDGNDDQADEYAPVPVTGDHTFATTY